MTEGNVGRVFLFRGPDLDDYMVIPSPDVEFGNDMVATDFNQDGQLDLLVGGSVPGYGNPTAVHYFLGPDMEYFDVLTPLGIVDTSGMGMRFTAGDFDGDGWPDVAGGFRPMDGSPSPDNDPVYVFDFHD